MTYLAYVIALLGVVFGPTGRTFNQGVDEFLSSASHINGIFFWIAVGIWLLAVAIPFLLGRRSKSGGGGFTIIGCLSTLLVFLPLVQLFLWRLSLVMSGSFDATTGVTDPVKFWASVFFTILLGCG